MAANTVSVDITLEERDVLRSLNNLTKGVDKFSKDAEKSVRTVDLAVASFAGNIASAAVIGGFKLLATGVKALSAEVVKFVDLASIQEDAIQSLNTQLAITGQFSQETSQDLQDYASSLQEVSKFGDEAIISQIAFAQAMGATVDQSKDIVTAAADMASALNIDLNSAVRNISKTLGGYAGELGEVIPELKNLTAEQLKAGDGVELLAAKFAGAATGQIGTFSGALTQLKNTVGDTQESFGLLITQNPLVIGAIKGIQDVFKQIQLSVTANKEAFNDFVSNGVIFFIEAIGSAIKAVSQFNSAIIIIQNFGDRFNQVMAAVIGGAANFTASVAESLNKLNGLVGLTNTTLEEFAETQRGVAAETVKEFSKINDEIDKRIAKEEEFSKAVDKFSEETVATLRDRVEAAKTQYDADANSFVENLNKKNQALLGNTEANQIAFDAISLLREGEIENIRENFELENEAIQVAGDKRFQILEQGLGREEALREILTAKDLARQGKREAAQKKLAAALSKSEKQITKNKETEEKVRETNLASSLGVISTLTALSNKQLFAIGKAASLAQAIIRGQLAIQNALAAAPPPFNFALAAAVGVATAVQINKIKSTPRPSFQDGGIVPGNSFFGDKVQANVNSGELILNRQQQANLFNRLNQTPTSTVGQANSIAAAAFAQPIVVEIDGREVARAVRNETTNGFTL